MGNNGTETVTDNARTSLATRKMLLAFQHCIGAPERAPFPVIVALHGHVIGLGVDIIGACDIRYAAANTSFAIKVRRLLARLDGQRGQRLHTSPTLRRRSTSGWRRTSARSRSSRRSRATTRCCASSRTPRARSPPRRRTSSGSCRRWYRVAATRLCMRHLSLPSSLLRKAPLL